MKFVPIVLSLLILLSGVSAAPRHVHRGASGEQFGNSVWLLPKSYTQYVFSAPRNTLLGLTEDGFTVDALSLSTKAISHTFSLPLPDYMLAIGIDGTYATVVHNSYISFINVGSTAVQTLHFPYADLPVSGLVADLSNEHESCGWIHPYNTGAGNSRSKIVCANPSGNITECDDPEGGGFRYVFSALGAPDHRMIYAMTANGNGAIFKYIVNEVTPIPRAPQCPYYQYHRMPNWGNYSNILPDRMWFSYDCTRLFFNNGLTFTVSSDPSQDLQVHGAFNDSLAPQSFYWIVQGSEAPYYVIALHCISFRFNTCDKALPTIYNWPQLRAKDDIEIPVPTTPAGLSVHISLGSQIYFNPTNKNEVYIVVNYTTDSLYYKPGIAFVDITASTV